MKYECPLCKVTLSLIRTEVQQVEVIRNNKEEKIDVISKEIYKCQNVDCTNDNEYEYRVRC